MKIQINLSFSTHPLTPFLILIFAILFSACSGSNYPFDNDYDSSYLAQEYAEGKALNEKIKNDPCFQDIMYGVPDEYQRCGNNQESNSSSSSSSTYHVTGCVNVSRLNVRSGPSTSYDVVNSISRGDCVQLTGRNSNGSWAKFSSGWISTAYLDYSKSLSGLPIISFTNNSSSSNTSSGSVCTCSYNAYNCNNFPSQSSAQSCYQYCLNSVGYDVHWLDDDKDGKACELNP